MRIAFYTPWVGLSERGLSGDHMIARAVIAGLEHEGHEVYVMPEFKAKRLWARRRRLLRLPGVLWSAYHLARDAHVDVWLTFVTQRDAPDIFGPLISRALGIGYVIYQVPYRGTWAQLRHSKGLLGHLVWLPGLALNHMALAAADVVIANKEADRAGYAASARVRPKLELLWPAVSLEEFQPDPARRAKVRADLGITAGTCVILSVARLDDRKGVKRASTRFLIDCTTDLVAAGRDVRVVIVGDGDGRPALEAQARAAGTAGDPGTPGDTVLFAGAVEHDEVRAWFNAADVFAYPGLREAIGMVYLEAQACALPVVAFDNGGIPHIVLDGKTGFLVAPMDRVGFVGRLEALIDDPELGRRMGRAGRAHVAEHHDAAAWSARLSALVGGAGRHRRPPRGRPASR